MAEIVNLNKRRKQRAREAAVAQAAANRVRHGRTAVERERDRREADRPARAVDDARLDAAGEAPTGE